MTIVDIILFALTTIGLTQLIVESSIFDPIRRTIYWLLVVKFVEFVQKRIGMNVENLKSYMEHIYSMFECHQCAGTWCGFLCGYVFLETGWEILLYGAAGGFLARFTAFVITYLEAQSTVILKDSNYE